MGIIVWGNGAAWRRSALSEFFSSYVWNLFIFNSFIHTIIHLFVYLLLLNSKLRPKNPLIREDLPLIPLSPGGSFIVPKNGYIFFYPRLLEVNPFTGNNKLLGQASIRLFSLERAGTSIHRCTYNSKYIDFRSRVEFSVIFIRPEKNFIVFNCVCDFFFWMLVCLFVCLYVCLFVDTITLERLNQSEPNFHIWLLTGIALASSKMGIAGHM